MRTARASTSVFPYEVGTTEGSASTGHGVEVGSIRQYRAEVGSESGFTARMGLEWSAVCTAQSRISGPSRMVEGRLSPTMHLSAAALEADKRLARLTPYSRPAPA